MTASGHQRAYLGKAPSIQRGRLAPSRQAPSFPSRDWWRFIGGVSVSACRRADPESSGGLPLHSWISQAGPPSAIFPCSAPSTSSFTAQRPRFTPHTATAGGSKRRGRLGEWAPGSRRSSGVPREEISPVVQGGASLAESPPLVWSQGTDSVSGGACMRLLGPSVGPFYQPG